MLSALLLASVVVTAAPRPLPNADSGIYVPRLDRMNGVLAFMGRAGERSVLMRPSTWFADFHPLLYVDFTRPESLKGAGINPSGSATVTFRRDGRMSCVEVADAKLFAKRARERLVGYGEVWEGKLSGAPVVAAKTKDGVIVAGYAQSGSTSCAIIAAGDGTALMNSAAAAVKSPRLEGGWTYVKDLSGEVFLVTREGAAGLDGDAGALRVDGRTPELPVPALQSGEPSPYAGMPPTGLLVARSKVKASEVPGALQNMTGVVARLCAKCDRQAVAALSKELAAQLTGNVAVAVQSLNVSGRLSTDAQRFLAAKQVWLGEVKDAQKAAQALGALAKFPGARVLEDGGYALAIEGGEVRVGVKDRHLYLANDADALQAVLASVPAKGGTLRHGAEFALDPQKTSRALGRISVFDVIGSKELAGLFAMSTEVGPLLTITQAVTGWADAAPKGHRFGLLWTLKPAPPPKTPGVTPGTDGGTQQ